MVESVLSGGRVFAERAAGQVVVDEVELVRADPVAAEHALVCGSAARASARHRARVVIGRGRVCR